MIYKKKIDIEELTAYLKSREEFDDRMYIGCDSERVKRNGIWYADYCTVVVIHKGGNSGCKIFGEITRERDFDGKLDRPILRMMTEVYRVSAFYQDNFELLDPFSPEIHLDINPSIDAGSSCAIMQAVGYIKGVCGIDPKVKPEAFSASYAADRYAYIQSHTTKKKLRRVMKKQNKKMKRNNK